MKKRRESAERAQAIKHADDLGLSTKTESSQEDRPDTPPMGYNSWTDVKEAVQEMAAFPASNRLARNRVMAAMEYIPEPRNFMHLPIPSYVSPLPPALARLLHTVVWWMEGRAGDVLYSLVTLCACSIVAVSVAVSVAVGLLVVVGAYPAPSHSHLETLVEAIALNMHETWAENRCRQGWCWGRARDDFSKLHPDLIPYVLTHQWVRDRSLAALH